MGGHRMKPVRHLTQAHILQGNLKNSVIKKNNSFFTMYLKMEMNAKPKSTKTICPHNNLRVNVHSSIILNTKKWKKHKYPSVYKGVNEMGPSMQWCHWPIKKEPSANTAR